MKLLKLLLIIFTGSLFGIIVRATTYNCFLGNEVECYEGDLPNWGWITYIVLGNSLVFSIFQVYDNIKGLIKKSTSYEKENIIAYCNVCGATYSEYESVCLNCGNLLERVKIVRYVRK